MRLRSGPARMLLRSGRAMVRRAAGTALVVLLTLLAVLLPATATTGAPVPTQGWSWPLSPAPAVLRAFRPPLERWAPGHRGVDLAAGPGQQVLAPAAGTVAFAGFVVDRGVLTITHPNGLRSSIEPVTPVVSVGDVVARGQPVARVAAASSHCPGSSCLHWGVRRSERYLDPLALLFRPPPSVLLPLDGSPAWSPR